MHESNSVERLLYGLLEELLNELMATSFTGYGHPGKKRSVPGIRVESKVVHTCTRGQKNGARMFEWNQTFSNIFEHGGQTNLKMSGDEDRNVEFAVWPLPVYRHEVSSYLTGSVAKFLLYLSFYFGLHHERKNWNTFSNFQWIASSIFSRDGGYQLCFRSWRRF